MTSFCSELVQVLHERGFIYQATDLQALDLWADEGGVTGYIGFDLTAPSLHVGSLIQIMALRWLARYGKAIVLLGWATTEVGDPTGKDKQRPLLDHDTISKNATGIKAVLERLVTPARPGNVQFVSNMRWMGGHRYIDFLRKFGPHFTVNRMLTFDSVKDRLARQEPMTFLEFNYMVMQAVDFYELHQSFGCTLQIGGSDQWGNIVNGVELVRRASDGVEKVFGLTTPLLTNAAGEKMGKTAGGAIWLDPQMTSPFDFWQFWRNVEDEKVESFLKLFTELGLDVIDHLMGVNGPGIVAAKEVLATEVTALVHGRVEAERAAQEARTVMAGGTPTTHVLTLSRQRLFTGRERVTIAEALLDLGFVRSKGDADRLAAQEGVRVNGVVEKDVRRHFAFDDLPEGQDAITVAVGKKKVGAVRMEQ